MPALTRTRNHMLDPSLTGCGPEPDSDRVQDRLHRLRRFRDSRGRRFGVMLMRNAPVAFHLAQAYGQPEQETVFVRWVA
jgi:hypothetical protein